MLDLTLRQVVKARDDIAASARKWPVWHMLAWQEIRQRYRRSTFGPFWLTLSMGVQITVMGVVMASLFGQHFGRTLPYVALGFIFWSMIAGIINDGAMAFVGSSTWILQINLPLGTYIFQKIWSNTIAMAHNLAIFVVLIFIYRLYALSILLFFVTLPIVLVALSWAPLLLAIVSTRFRDIPAIITNSFSLLFWVTPIVYRPEQLGHRIYLAEYNPLTHILALLRDPLLGIVPSFNDMLWVCGTAVVGWAITFPFYARFRGRIAFWL
jgi:lipopolysaccharide transport system permease protein